MPQKLTNKPANRIRVLLLASLILVMGLVSTAFAAPQVTGWAVPANLHVYSKAGSAYVDMPVSGCATSGRYLLENSHVRYDSIMRLLTAATLAGREARLRFDGCNSGGQGIIIGAYLK